MKSNGKRSPLLGSATNGREKHSLFKASVYHPSIQPAHALGNIPYLTTIPKKIQL